MDSKRTFSGILQIVLGAGILAAGGILFYQKLTNGGPEKLSLKYTCESFRAIKEAQTVAQEQSLKLEKMLNLQLLHFPKLRPSIPVDSSHFRHRFFRNRKEMSELS